MDTSQIFEFIETYSYWFIFFGLFLENAAFIGFFFPGVTILFCAGFLVSTGSVDPVLAATCAYAGTLLGDNVNYALGRWGAKRLKWVQRLLDKFPQAVAFINKQPVWLYTFFHFPGILRPVVPIALGSSMFSFRLWLVIDLIGAALFVAAYLIGGYYTAELSMELSGGQSMVNQVVLFFGLLIGIWAIVQLARWRLKKRRSAPGA